MRVIIFKMLRKNPDSNTIRDIKKKETVIWSVNGNTAEFLPSNSSTFGYLSNLVNNRLMIYFHVHDSTIYFSKSKDINI